LLKQPHRKGEHDIHQCGTSGEQVPVIVLLDRQGATTDFKLKTASQIEEAPILSQVLASDAVLCTDGNASLRSATRQAGIAHRSLNQSAGIRVLTEVYHIQNVDETIPWDRDQIP